MSVAAFDLFKAPEFAYPAGEAILSAVTGVMADSFLVLSVDQEHALGLSVPLEEPWVELAVPGRVLRMTGGNEPWEWWINSRTEDVVDGEDMVSFGLDPLHRQLVSVGAIRDIYSGGVTWTQGGGVGLSPKNYIQTYILPWLAERGIDYYAVGTIDDNSPLELDFENLTPLALIVKLAEETDQEWYIGRDETNRKYTINLVSRVGSAHEDALAAEAMNLLALNRDRDVEDLRSLINPTGGAHGDTDRRADIGFNVWEVTGVATDDITVAAIDGGDGPIGEDGQFAAVSRDGSVIWDACYLEADDGTYHEIEGSVFDTQVFELEAGAGSSFAVGDRVSIVRDSSGTLLTELPSPSAMALYGVHSGPYENTALRGERNWIVNPFANDWTADPTWYAGRVDGAQSSTSITFKDLPASTLIPENAALFFATGTGPISTVRINQSDQTTSGTGAVTLTLNLTIAVSDNDPVWVSLGLLNGPDDWSPNSDAGVVRMKPQGAFTGTAQADGAYAANDPWMNLKGLGDGGRVTAGSVLQPSGETGAERLVLFDATANASGEATVIAVATGDAVTDSTNVEVSLPVVPVAGHSDYVFGLLSRGTGAMTALPSALVRETTGADRVIFAVEFVVYNAGTASIDVPAADSPRVELWRVDGTPTQLASIQAVESGAADHTVAAGDLWSGRIGGEYTIPEGVDPELEVRVQQADTVSADGTLVTWFQGGIVSLSEDESAPLVDGFNPRLWRQAQSKLGTAASWGATFMADVIDLSVHYPDDRGVFAPRLGGYIRIETRSPYLYELFRIQRMTMSVYELDKPRLVLDRVATTLTRQTRRLVGETQYVRVDTTVEDSSGEEIRVADTALASTDPPRSDGVPRAGVGVAFVDPDSDSAITIGPYSSS